MKSAGTVGRVVCFGMLALGMKNRGKWWLGTKIPKLGAVRGQIVLVRRFPAKAAMGIEATHWPDNVEFKNGALVVQDCYVVRDPDEKWKRVEKALGAAFADKDAGRLHLNFACGYAPGKFGIPDILRVSRTVNPELRRFFAAAPQGGYGCVIMDHADAGLARLIFETNFPKRKK